MLSRDTYVGQCSKKICPEIRIQNQVNIAKKLHFSGSGLCGPNRPTHPRFRKMPLSRAEN